MDGLKHIHDFVLRASIEIVDVENDAIDERLFNTLLVPCGHSGEIAAETVEVIVCTRDDAEVLRVVGALPAIANETLHLMHRLELAKLPTYITQFLRRRLFA